MRDAAWEQRPLCAPLYSQLAVFSTSMSQVALAGEMSHLVMRCPKCFSLICDLRTAYFTLTAFFPLPSRFLFLRGIVETIFCFDDSFGSNSFFANRKWLFTCERLDWHFSSSDILYQISLYFFFNVHFCLTGKLTRNCRLTVLVHDHLLNEDSLKLAPPIHLNYGDCNTFLTKYLKKSNYSVFETQ